MAGTIIADVIQSDQSYPSSINIASPMIVSNTISMTNGAISGNVNFDSGTLFVDATNNKVGVNNSNPAYAIHVLGTLDMIATQGATNSFFRAFNKIGSGGTTSDWSWGADDGAPSGTGSWILYDRLSASYRMMVDASGRVRMPYQPYGVASISGTLPGASGYVAQFYSGYSSSRGGLTIDDSNGRFTVPVDGAYLVGHHNLGNTGTGTCQITVRKNGSGITGGNTQDTNGANDNFSQQYIVELAANDYIDFYVAQGRLHNNQNYSRFYICLLG